MDALILGGISFCTSTIAGIFGVGGGLLLIAILPSFLPINALIPIHGLNQVTSNLSRAYFGYKDIQYRVIPKFFVGSLVGAGLFMYLLKIISIQYIPLCVGIYILLSLWSQTFNEKIKKYENYYLIGFLQTGISTIVGTTGPLTMTKLLKEFQDKDKVIATSALLMSMTHIFKIIVFSYFGFVFYDYFDVIIIMMLGSIFGSYVGKKLRNKIDGQKLIYILKILLSILALKSIVSAGRLLL